MTPNQPLGWVHEIFTSIQGEGLYCGQRQTFARLAGCNLSCDYCDTASSREPRPSVGRVEHQPGSGRFEEFANPIAVDDVVSLCGTLGASVVSLTGGEPLAQPDFLAALAPALKLSGFTVYLETNGTLHEELARVISFIDVVAMDIKLPGASGQLDLWEAHWAFLRVARETEVFVKVVVDNETSDKEIRRCSELIAGVSARTPLVIQPVSGERSPSGHALMRMQSLALETLRDVRVIPQCHKALELL